MLNGLYQVQFQTNQSHGAGVVFLLNGELWGGDSAFAFTGKFDENGDNIVARVKSKRHTDDQNFQSVFGVDNVDITLKGKVGPNGQTILFDGTAAQAPGVKFSAKLTLIAV